MKPMSIVRWLSISLMVLCGHSFAGIGFGDSAATVDHGAGPPQGPSLTLDQAIDRALSYSPDLASLRAEVPASDARTLQAGLWQNPQVELTIEDFGGSGTRKGFEQAQTTLQLEQPIELAGQPTQRRRVAVLGRRGLDRQIEARRLEVIAEVRKRFVKLLLAQERRTLSAEIETLSEESLHVVDNRVGAGAAAVSERGQVRILLSRARVELRRAEHEIVGARRQLAALWGDSEPEFTAAGSLEDVAPPPPLDELLPKLEQSPDLTRWEAEVERRVASVNLERLERIPDVTVSAGGRHYSDNGDYAAIVDFAVPLPLFDGNQAGVAEAENLLVKARAERDAAQLRARTELFAAYDEMHTQFERIAVLGVEVMSDAKAANTEILEAYRRGAAHSIDVLAAQRSLFELQDEYFQALAAYQTALVDVERLTAAPAVERTSR